MVDAGFGPTGYSRSVDALLRRDRAIAARRLNSIMADDGAWRQARRFARSERELLAVQCLRLVLGAHEEADIARYAQAHDCAERLFARRCAVEFVRTISSIARALRRRRVNGFCFFPGARDLLTHDEYSFLSALQAAIDGSPAGLEAAAHILSQSGETREIVDDIRRLAQLVLAA